MNSVRGSTASETRMIRAVQKAVGLKHPDGAIGACTMAGVASKLGANCFPLTLKVWGAPCILAQDIIVCNPKKPCGNFKNSMNGSFSMGGKPISIMVSDGTVVCDRACHSWQGRPESVLYRLEDGTFGVKRCMDAQELPTGVRWAVGGMGLLDMYDPYAEGFCRFSYNGRSYDFSDVRRKTDHGVVGVKDGVVWLIHAKDMTGAQINSLCLDKLCLDLAILVDGGHYAAMNGEESFAKINTRQTQYFMLQAI